MNKGRMYLTLLLIFFGVGVAKADPKGKSWAQPVLIDTGNFLGGFDVAIDTFPVVKLSDSGETAGVIWRARTFQVTDSSYAVWVGTHSGIVWGTGAGWFILGSTGSYTTRSQAVLYGVLDPAAGAGAATINGPYEYQAGEMP